LPRKGTRASGKAGTERECAAQFGTVTPWAKTRLFIEPMLRDFRTSTVLDTMARTRVSILTTKEAKLEKREPGREQRKIGGHHLPDRSKN